MSGGGLGLARDYAARDGYPEEMPVTETEWEYHPLARREQGPLDNLLWRAKRQWHRWFP
jgi:hypothetical protein